ncbi:MAG: DUF507 family protein [Nitrospirota bacterium]
MRLPKEWRGEISKRIIEDLIEREFVRLKIPKENAIKIVDEIITEELLLEDKLNEEIKDLLKQYESEIEKNKLDYRKLFELTKQRLAKERNIIL